MAKWTLETSEAAASQPLTGFGGPNIAPPVNISPGLPMINPPAPDETAQQWTGTRPVLLPAPVTQDNGCKSGCGVPYPGSSPGTAVAVGASSATVKAADTVTNLLSGWKSWPWWVWLVLALVVLLLVRR